MAKTKLSKLTAYCLTQKLKNVPFVGTPKINKNGNRYILQGENEAGHKMSKIMGAETALEAIKTKEAIKGNGWD